MKKKEKKIETEKPETKNMENTPKQEPEKKQEEPPKPKPKTLEQKYQEALDEIDELKKKRMFLQAEMENSQKIALKRIENSKYNIKVDVIKNFLPLVDSFEAAISKYESTEKKEYDLLLEGIISLQKQFIQVLRGMGIKPIDQINVPFNYKEHDVFMRMEDNEQPEDTVIKIAHKGYYLGENVLRPAKVIVSKKKEKPEAIPVEAEQISEETTQSHQAEETSNSTNSSLQSEKLKPEENLKQNT